MKKTLSLFTLVLLSIFYTQAQDLENALLWKISGNGLQEASYVFGTIHMTCDASLNDDVKNALDKTSLLVLELDMDDPSMNATMMSNMAMKDNQNIKDLLSDEEYATLDAFTQSNFGAPLAAFATFKPFFISAMTYTKFLDCPIQSYEGALMAIAQEQKEEILGLETVEEQLNIFDEIPYTDQIKDLMVSVEDNLTEDKAKFQKLMEYYKNADLSAIQEMTETDETLTMQKHKDLMLNNRNKKWISKMEVFSKEQPTFFGVGAAHLIGEKGVIQLLRDQGYTVTAVK
jgi:uncharacterized protein YbaP (TraB family)